MSWHGIIVRLSSQMGSCHSFVTVVNKTNGDNLTDKCCSGASVAIDTHSHPIKPGRYSEKPRLESCSLHEFSIWQSGRSWYWKLSTPVTSHYLQSMEKLEVRNTWCQYSDSCHDSQNKDATGWRRGYEDYSFNSSLAQWLVFWRQFIRKIDWLEQKMIHGLFDLWAMTSFFWMESDPGSLISFILSLIWLESGLIKLQR